MKKHNKKKKKDGKAAKTGLVGKFFLKILDPSGEHMFLPILVVQHDSLLFKKNTATCENLEAAGGRRRHWGSAWGGHVFGTQTTLSTRSLR